MDGVPEIPPFFICPISLQIMMDPVTVCTGITYDRESIHKWLLAYKKKTCPVTKQVLTDHSLTPNSTLLRLIQSWLGDNPLAGQAEGLLETTPTIDGENVRKLIDGAKSPVSDQLKALRKIRSLLKENESNKRLMEEAGLAPVMASLVAENYAQDVASQFDQSEIIGEEALSTLSLLHLSPETATRLAGMDLITCLSWVLQRGSYNARVHAATVLRSVCKSVQQNYLMSLQTELFDGIVEILKDQNSNQATMAALSILMEVCPWGKNRIKAVEAGVVPVVVEFLAENNERRKCEIMLGVLELLCGRAEGREAFLAHPASVAVVSRKIFRVSHVANEKAVRVLLLVSKYSSSSSLIQEMVDMGAVFKLCMVLQTECNLKTKQKAKEILRLHWRAWKAFPCVPFHGLSSVLRAVGESSS
ncbi:E3 ubiquitin-protein ligase PUB23-like [Nymphaea colorata]|uniref:U-box domain-containing protein n=1 Tax=Nymphaea colorata TaxID=210225 RepID=A0A5K1H582_9MAGN|nr:E3 ubiquitin-protein ligase PUB23-like [Nymphaea colorata]